MTIVAVMEKDFDDEPPSVLRVTPIQQRSEAMLARIEQAAIELIAEDGRDVFAMKDIPKRAGCSVGSLYRLFPDRKALLTWLYPQHTDGLGPLREGAGQPQPPAQQR